jgi:MerR family gold-responsive transcriptional activator of gol and ges genes
MNIGEAARASGVSAKMIRYYEQTGLIPQASRTSSGYREYTDADVQFLRFVRHARALGFSMPDIEELVGLWRDPNGKHAEVRLRAAAHIETLGKKITELKEMAGALDHLVSACDSESRPDCPVFKRQDVV